METQPNKQMFMHNACNPGQIADIMQVELEKQKNNEYVLWD